MMFYRGKRARKRTLARPVLLALSLPMAWLLRLIPGAGKWLT